MADPEFEWIEAVFSGGRRWSRGGVGHGSGKLAKGLREIKPRATEGFVFARRKRL
jgi:hypothetical protein